MTRFATLLCVLAFATPAFAELGGDASSITADRVHTQGALLRITSTDTFTVHEMQSATGTMIREYVSPLSGKVFAVAWDGPFLPDLRQVLGSYFDTYQREAARVRTARRAHGPIAIDTGELVVQVAGHTRYFTGRAYATRLVPNGVERASIK
ncbi:MAG TPA: DUF2844 domain-containing protein [Vicinamibacterales bacterium]|nr:DUF2844 domain-containing protein [Vicinamibacterales bacterium]